MTAHLEDESEHPFPSDAWKYQIYEKEEIIGVMYLQKDKVNGVPDIIDLKCWRTENNLKKDDKGRTN